jgi:hypothetical protein
VDVARGQKTGFYLDQRDNRHLASALADGAEVLNCFCYTGGFSLSALRGGAKRVTSLDTSDEALGLARHNASLNSLDSSRAEWLAADVFVQLRKFRDQGRKFDLIVLDPPKFAPTEKHVPNAARAYKDINLWAMKLLAPAGTPAHVLVFRGREPRPVPQDRRRRGGRCALRPADPQAPGRRDRPSGIDPLPRGRVPQGTVDAGELGGVLREYGIAAHHVRVAVLQPLDESAFGGVGRIDADARVGFLAARG